MIATADTSNPNVNYNLTYQWYSSPTNSNSDGKGEAIPNATQPSYTIPTGLNAGTHYYYCLVTAQRTDNSNKVSVFSPVATVTVNKAGISPALAAPSNYTYAGTLPSSLPEVSENPGGGAVTYYYTNTNSTDNGTPWDKVEADINYSAVGAQCCTVAIQPKSITGAAVILDAYQRTYNAQEQTVTVTGVTLDGFGNLTAGTDYTVTNGTTGTNASEYTVTVTGTGNYKDTATAAWKIVEKTMTVEAQNVTHTYDGTPIGIQVNVTDPATEYTILYGTEESNYSNNAPTQVNAGFLTVYYQVTASNYETYKGYAVVTVTPKPVTIKDVAAESRIYAPNLNTVKLSGGTVDGVVTVNGTEDDLSADLTGALGTMDDPNAGESKPVTVTGAALTGTDAGNYELTEQPAGVTVTIEPKSITGAEVKLDKAQVTYNADTQETVVVSVTLTDGTVLLDTDYETDESSETAKVNKGTYTVTVNGVGNYKDSAAAEWKIVEKAMEVSAENVEKVYSGESWSIDVKVSDPASGAVITYGLSEGTYDLDENPAFSAVGVYEVYYKVSADNYTETTGSATVTISEAAPPEELAPDEKPVPTDPTYTGDPIPLVNEPEKLPEGYDEVWYSTDGGQTWTKEPPEGTDSGVYPVMIKYTDSTKNHVDKIDEVIVTIDPAMTNRVDLINLLYNGSRALPKEIKSLTLEPVIHIAYGEKDSVTKDLTFDLKQGMENPKKYENVEFTIEVPGLAPGKYEVTVTGLPKVVYGQEAGIYSADDGMIEGRILWKYALSAKAEINVKKAPGKIEAETIITVYLIWDDGSRPETNRVYALPEDEIGAYKLREDGTKEYLLFQTYDICIAWLGNEELCRGYDRCFHKEWGDWPLANK